MVNGIRNGGGEEEGIVFFTFARALESERGAMNAKRDFEARSSVCVWGGKKRKGMENRAWKRVFGFKTNSGGWVDGGVR